MTSHRERAWMRGRANDAKPCPFCGHDTGSHRGFPIADCIHPGCDCLTTYRDGQPVPVNREEMGR